MSKKQQTVEQPFFQQPIAGTALTILAGLSFLFLCMILPLVGPAGSVVPHARANFLGFLGMLLLTLALAGLAVYSKLERRKVDGSPLPYYSMILTGICVFLLVALLTGLLKT